MATVTDKKNVKAVWMVNRFRKTFRQDRLRNGDLVLDGQNRVCELVLDDGNSSPFRGCFTG